MYLSKYFLASHFLPRQKAARKERVDGEKIDAEKRQAFQLNRMGAQAADVLEQKQEQKEMKLANEITGGGNEASQPTNT